MSTPHHKLSPEQKEALNIFLESLPKWKEFYVDQLPSKIFEDNSRYFTSAPIKKESFPREPHWTWNRSNGTISIDLLQQFRIRLAKFNSRKRRQAIQQQPSYKIWSYAVTVLDTNEEFSFIWCTKGKPRCQRERQDSKVKVTVPIVPVQVHSFTNSNSEFSIHSQVTTDDNKQKNGSNSIDDLRLADFSFLKPFTDPDVAEQLGW